MIYCFICMPISAVLFMAIFITRRILKTRGFLGFIYDAKARVFYSVKRNWQTFFGYCKKFDEVGLKLNMVLDTEPIYFHYDGYDWLIQLWKGQYGITAGGEIGIYRKKAKRGRKHFDPTKIHYNRIPKSELLHVGISVWTKEGRRLFYREARERWLNGFALGECFLPDTLCMQARIVFAETEMLTAFANALYNMGYAQSEVNVTENSVSINFDTPKTLQVNSKTIVTRKMFFLCSLVEEFNETFALFTDTELTTSKKIRRKLNCRKLR